MYEIPIPDNFKEGMELLRLANHLMIEPLKLEAGKILAKNLTTENYLKTSQAAEMYCVENLVTACAKFVFEKVKGVAWEEMEKLPKVMSALVKIAKVKKVKEVDWEEMEKFPKFMSAIVKIAKAREDTGCVHKCIHYCGLP